MLLECLDATERLAGAEDRCMSARAFARPLSPTAAAFAIGRELSRLERLGLVEVWFRGGASCYRRTRGNSEGATHGDRPGEPKKEPTLEERRRRASAVIAGSTGPRV